MTQQDYIRRQNLCKGFIRSLRPSLVIDAMQAAASCRETWGINVDWHDMSTALESMAVVNGGVRAVGFNAQRLTQYVIDPEA